MFDSFSEFFVELSLFILRHLTLSTTVNNPVGTGVNGSRHQRTSSGGWLHAPGGMMGGGDDDSNVVLDQYGIITTVADLEGKIFGLSIKEANLICGVNSVLLNHLNCIGMTSKILFTRMLVVM